MLSGKRFNPTMSSVTLGIGHDGGADPPINVDSGVSISAMDLRAFTNLFIMEPL
jgi:hypothetical protein